MKPSVATGLRAIIVQTVLTSGGSMKAGCVSFYHSKNSVNLI